MHLLSHESRRHRAQTSKEPSSSIRRRHRAQTSNEPCSSVHKRHRAQTLKDLGNSTIKGPRGPLVARIIEFSPFRSHKKNCKKLREYEYANQCFNKGQNRHYKGQRLPKRRRMIGKILSIGRRRTGSLDLRITRKKNGARGSRGHLPHQIQIPPSRPQLEGENQSANLGRP